MRAQWDAERLLHDVFDRDTASWDRATLIAIGESAFARTFALSRDTSGKGFFDGGRMFARAHHMSRVDLFILHQLQLKGLAAALLPITRWYEQGCPIVMLESQTYAAALAATSCPANIDVTTPYASTLFQLPGGLFEDIWGVMVCRPELDDDMWTIIVFFQGGRLKKTTVRLPLSAHISGVALDDERLGDPNEGPGTAVDSWRCAAPTDAIMRKQQVATRIAFGACLAVTAHRPGSDKLPQGSGGQFRRTGHAPFHRVLAFGRPVSIDCRHAIRDYIVNGAASRGPLTLQFMVRGHWRNQACGLSFADRRLTWIEPYWKGPEDGPVNVRAHKLQEGQ